MTTKPHPQIVSQAEWLKKRKELLAEEKKHTEAYDKLNAKRRRLPMVKLEKGYAFEGPNGKVSLLDLFGGKDQLIVYHFMFDPSWEKGCPGCTSFVDALGDLSMLEERRTSFAIIARAPFEKLEKYRKEREWNRNFLSSFGSDFNYDFHVTLDKDIAPRMFNFRDEEEMAKRKDGHWTFKGETHGLSVFFRIDEDIFHTYSAFARGVESLTDAYPLLDCTPYGRQEDFEDSPDGWPQKPTYG